MPPKRSANRKVAVTAARPMMKSEMYHGMAVLELRVTNRMSRVAYRRHKATDGAETSR